MTGITGTRPVEMSSSEVLEAIVPALTTGPPGLAEKLCAYIRMARFDRIFVDLASTEREWLAGWRHDRETGAA
jgi:hypothetical protein